MLTRVLEALKPAQRNYILSHSTSVFNKNYQPRDLGCNLSTIAFPNHAGGDTTEKLSELMRNTSFTWNENAPIYPTQEDLDSFERNSRIRAYRDEYANLKDDCSPEAKKQANRVQSQISKSIDILCARAVERRRDEFWKKADRRNAEGKGTDDLQTEHINPRKARHQDSIVPATQIGQILSKDNVGSNVFSNSLVAFLKCRDCDIETLLGEDVGSQQPTQVPGSTCLLCKVTFTERRNLTRHNTNIHQAQFQRPFNCPSCKNQCVINGAADWERHVITFHGKHNAPRWPPSKKAATTTTLITRDRLDNSKHMCCLCGRTYDSKKALTRHNTEIHHAEGKFNEPFSCPACNIVNKEPDCTINNADEWSNHVAKVHGEHNAPAMPSASRTSFRRKRKRNNDDLQLEKGEVEHFEPNLSESREVKRADKGRLEKYKGKEALCLFCGLTTSPGRTFSAHLSRRHRELFKSEFSCPTCLKLGREVCISCRYDWTRHLSEDHGGDNGALLVEAGRGEDSAATKGEIRASSIPDTLIDPILRSDSV